MKYNIGDISAAALNAGTNSGGRIFDYFVKLVWFIVVGWYSLCSLREHQLVLVYSD